MAGGISYVSWTGVASCMLGGIFYLVAWAQGSKARQIERAKVIHKLSDLAILADVLPILVAVTGRVWTDKPLKCELSDTPAVIAEVVEDQLSMKHLVGETWVKDVQRVRSSVRETPWCIEEQAAFPTARVRLPVQDGREALLDNVMQLSGDAFEDSNRPLARKALDIVMGWRVIGNTKTERVLPVGMVVTAIGEVAKANDAPHTSQGMLKQSGDTVVLRAPQAHPGVPFIISRRPLPTIVRRLDEVSRGFRLLSYGCLAFGLTIVAVKAARAFQAHKRQQQLRERIARATSQLLNASDDGDDEIGAAGSTADMCAVCLSNPCSAVFTPCGHMCTCIACAERMDRCPICRSRSRAIRVYKP